MNEPQETILIVEDDDSLAKGLKHNLEFEGYRVLLARDGLSGLRMACDHRPDLIVLDLMLPGLDGLELLETLRSEDLDMQVLILSAKGRQQDKVNGLKLGADDYLTKPFGLEELLARIEAALRRTRRQQTMSLVIGHLQVDQAKRQVLSHGVPIRLTAREFDLLLFLAKRPNLVHSRERILRHVWGYDYEGTERTVDNFIRSLRSKLEPDPDNPQFLLTEHKIGYRFALKSDLQ